MRRVCRDKKGCTMDIIISNTSGVPIYEQIEEQIKGMIMTGELKAGDALPSMRVLAKDLRISVITTKRAFEDLERDGFIESVIGKGSFVKGMNSEIMKESMLVAIEECLEKAVDKAVMGKVSLKEMLEMLRIIYEERKNNG
jgi:GntR family transcriptional regulator